LIADLEKVVAETEKGVKELEQLLDTAEKYADDAYVALKDHQALKDYIAADAKKTEVKDFEGWLVDNPIKSEDLVLPEDEEDTDDENAGDENTGDENTGDENTGDENTDDENTGDENTDGENTGDENTGDENVGEDEIVEEEEDSDYPYTKYTSNENKIVLVTYDNGTSFILNFNNYAVTAVVNGVEYTVNGYSYIMFTK
jgi:hypothetical protein